ncbi:hypothetical protein [Kibdelosporangium phytohabitans]|uniref:Uncharacterized protein n=1 Tax=Kibdelosporangium phytohabitans TaxID=860235 RepID=A0A0N9IED0_9PSEU|nr:hypothetical protein [Kibdelosporangium phytohabitans]ALG13168.1 hypothetical protein AOZ06_45570 [Kibdelosporangium phytohabitans]MBE1464927.1 hypothetical protein [Kibdelosporangium phytohabitans]
MAASPTHPNADWGAFPLDRKPRPIIVVSPPQQAKHTLTVTSAEQPPATVPVALPDGTVELPTIPAAQAAAAASARGESELPVSASLTSAVFRTDRGEVTLPVWRFGTSPAVEWPALDSAAFWKLGKVRVPVWGTAPAKLTGLKLTVSLPYSPEPCPDSPAPQFRGVVTESGPTVMVHAAPAVPQRCAPGRSDVRPFEVTLREPLGARVLVDGAGSAIAVEP